LAKPSGIEEAAGRSPLARPSPIHNPSKPSVTAIADDDHHGEQNEEEFANGFWGIVIKHSFAIVRSAGRQCPLCPQTRMER
jgi:hypothetical protein